MSDMKTAIAVTLEHEGGFQNDRDDRANWSGGKIGVGELLGTNYGITALDLAEFHELFPGIAIPDITAEQATAFYARKFWNPMYSNINSQAITNKIFDLGVLFGEQTVVKVFQTVLDVTSDGDFGPVTLVRTNMANTNLLLEEFKNDMRVKAALIAAVNPAEAGDLKGWLTRINS